jgi:metal-dependent HD superfamily phosphatase/phosphodiesterase
VSDIEPTVEDHPDHHEDGDGAIEPPATGERGISLEAERGAQLPPRDAVRAMRIRLPARGNKTLRTILERVNRDTGLKALWHVANVNATRRMRINDHSWVHIQIVTNLGLKLVRDLMRKGAQPGMIKDYGMRPEDAEVVVVLGCLWHCVGMAVHRRGHEDWSLFLAADRLPPLLEGIYEEPEQTVVIAEVLQTITAHRADGEPLSLEAGIVRVADALDMSKGRSRIPFTEGRVSIHSLSAAAIERVTIKDGEARPILVEIEMNNSAGVYQVDELLRKKLRGSGLEDWIEVVARIETEQEKLLVPIVRL